MADNARETVDPVRSRSDHRRAEGHQRQLRHFEALLSDGDTKDRDAPETTKNDIADRHFKASRPKNTIQIRFTRKETPPPPYMTSFPKGKKARLANLKHCSPTGIPMMVTHHRHPASTHASPPISPPNRNQRILPITVIFLSPFIFLFVLCSIHLVKTDCRLFECLGSNGVR